MKCFKTWLAACFGLTATFWSIPVVAEEAPSYLVRIPVPIVGSIDTRIKNTIDRMLTESRGSEERPILVIEFWPPRDADAAASSEFERSLSLARYLASERLNRLRTVAYLPRSVMGHAVLPVMACEEIVMHPDAELGDAGRSEELISMTIRGAYTEVANRRRTIPEAVAIGMLDKEQAVFQLETATGTKYVLGDELEAAKQTSVVNSIDTLFAAGEPGRLSGRALRVLGFVSHLATDRRDLASALGIRAGRLEPDPSMGGDWKPIRLDLNGVVSDQAVNRIIRNIEEQMRVGGVNFVCISIHSPGGSPSASISFANFLASLDSSVVRTVAYIEEEARGDAALVALACDQIVMAPEAVLGGPGTYQPTVQEIQDLRTPIKQFSREKSRRWSIPLAMIDANLSVHQYQLSESTIKEYFSPEELDEQPDPTRWKQQDELSPPGELLSVLGDRAEELGIAKYAVENLEEFKQLYHLENDPALVEPGWADDFIDYLSSPSVAATLLFFGGFALMMELSSPGLGVGAFLAAICFVLFFWSQFLHGTATWLEILLFFTGLAFVAIEIFIVPGIGIFGLGGAALMMASLILASQTFVVPQNSYQMQQLPRSLLTIAGGAGGLMLGLVVLSRFLDKAPFLRRLMLTPPQGDPVERDRRESLVDFSHLINQVGQTTTPLVPGGKAMFGDRLVDVLSDGRMIDRGTRVRVVEVAGNRVLVKPV